MTAPSPWCAQVDQQPAERDHRDFRHAGARLLEHRDPLLQGNIGSLEGFSSDADHHRVEGLGCSSDDVEMTVRHGVERPRTQGGQGHHTSMSPCRSRDRNSVTTLSP